MPEDAKRQELSEIIRQWNGDRLDLFEITQPDENLEFYGVIRFYFEDHIEGNVATKCLRVCSSSSTREVVEILSEKFRPDMKMLTMSYSLFEVHTDEERKLSLDERPLVVQLGWKSDNREGRFVLKKDVNSLEESCQEKEKGGIIQIFKRTLSQKGKTKEKKKASAAKTLSVDEMGSTEDLLKNNKESKHVKEKKEEATENHVRLPAEICFSDNTEEPFLSAVINYTNSSTVHFKLSPAYILYAASHFALQRHRGQGSPSSESTHGATLITNTMVTMTGKVIQKQKAIAGPLAFWMANSSELLNFLKHDKDLSMLTQQSQLDLSHQVYRTYSYLLECLQDELKKHLPTFLIDPEQHGALPAGIEMVLNTLMNAMSLLRRCRVNPALTIQIFSQLFHFVSIWLFNQLMSPEARTPGLRSHYWGSALRQRLTAIEAWAERQGLELAADCHLGHIIQATTLLTMNKYSMQDAKDIQNTCFKLNSLQLRMLLSGYLYATNEPHIPPDLIYTVVRSAEASADNLLQSEGRSIQLEESLHLHLPFLLPEGGYSCDTVRGVPQGFREFLEPICQKGFCSLTSQPNSSGDWTVFFQNSVPSEDAGCLSMEEIASQRQPETETITLHKPLNSGMGVSIVAAKGAGQTNLGIYIKSIVKGGPAEMNGRLSVGDQLLKVDGHSLVGLSQERAAAVLMQTGAVVTLKVAKFGASFHGLGDLLCGTTADKTTRDRGFPKEKMSMLYCVVDLGPSGRLHGGSKNMKDQMMQRNRQLYRSNPNMTDLRLEDEPCHPHVKENILSVSSINLCSDTHHRGYLTLPNPKSKDKNLSESNRPQQTIKMSSGPPEEQCRSKRTYMRQALSQDNLFMDHGCPLLDKKKNAQQQKNQNTKQTQSSYTSFPLRISVSSHDILSNLSSPTKQPSSRVSAAGVWRMPFSQQSTPAPSVQPIRIDIPLTRAANSQSNPPLTTFQQSSFLAAGKMSKTLKVSGRTQSPAGRVSAIKKLPPTQQQRSSTCGNKTGKPQVSITPTKHVSFQADVSQQKSAASGVKQKDPQVLCDPWRREAQEKLEKEWRLKAVEHMEEEVQELQAKSQRTVEENDRLRKLSLEWQFQKRVQEMQQREEDEEDEDDLDMMVTLQQLENKKTPAKEKNNKWEVNEIENQAGNPKLEEKKSAHKGDVPNIVSEANQKREMEKSVSAPEKLPFRERQRLFSLAFSA